MPFAQSACLIGLILVSTTLPASAGRLPAPPDEETPAESTRNGSAPGETEDSERDHSSRLLAVPNVDVWNGGSGRALDAGLGSMPAALPHAGAPGPRITPADFDAFVRIGARRTSERAPRRWLTCRYAHAPPPAA